MHLGISKRLYHHLLSLTLVVLTLHLLALLVAHPLQAVCFFLSFVSELYTTKLYAAYWAFLARESAHA